MNNKRASIITVMVLGILLLAANAIAGDYSFSSVGVGGYDVVAYHTQGKALRGTGFHAAEHEGVTYLFTSKKNRDKFTNSPGNYLPEFGGFCAFGASVGKKIYADPTVWKIVDDKLYLNVDSKIQKKFDKDIRGNLAKAYANWPKIKDHSPEGL
jgi:YHS domain-containing protein